MQRRNIIPTLIDHNLIVPEQQNEYQEYLDMTGGEEYA